MDEYNINTTQTTSNLMYSSFISVIKKSINPINNYANQPVSKPVNNSRPGQLHVTRQ